MFKSGGDNRGAIFKEIPIANYAVHERTTARAFEGHQQRLRKISHQNVRPHNVGNGWSRNKPEYLHLTQNVKGAQMQSERYGTISRENQMLLQKIALMEQRAGLSKPSWHRLRPACRLSGGCSQRQSTPRAALSFGQLRPIRHLGRAGPRHIGLSFDLGASGPLGTHARMGPQSHCRAGEDRGRRTAAVLPMPRDRSLGP